MADVPMERLQVCKQTIMPSLDKGLALDQAFLVAGCSVDEIAALKADEMFMQMVAQRTALLELDYLKKLNGVADINAARGKSDELRFMLGVLNPERYGGKKKGEGDGNTNVVVHIGKEYDGV